MINGRVSRAGVALGAAAALVSIAVVVVLSDWLAQAVSRQAIARMISRTVALILMRGCLATRVPDCSTRPFSLVKDQNKLRKSLPQVSKMGHSGSAFGIIKPPATPLPSNQRIALDSAVRITM